jgi:NAD(P)-dependent dehydrogenase (short-subunit alcohol dehydrogenase family)
MVSGIGRLTAIALAGAGWCVTLTGRRKEALEETAILCGGDSNKERWLIIAGNIADEQFVEHLFEDSVQHFGELTMSPSLLI